MGDKVELHEMQAWAESEVTRLQVMGETMQRTGMREDLHPVAQRRMEVAQATANLLRWVRENEYAVKRRVKRNASKSRKR